MCGNSFLHSCNTPICAICLNELLNIPSCYVLNCGHVYCRLCLLGINRAFMRYNVVKCPLCSTHRTSTLCIDLDLKCTLCRRNLLKINDQNEALAHLTCGHFYCLTCIIKISNCLIAKCVRCKVKHIVNPLFF